MKTLKSIKTNCKNIEAMITKADKGNSVVILPIQHYNEKINNFISENHFQTINIDPTNTFQNHIRKTINHSKTLIPQEFKRKKALNS
jgi:GT2 family glycosyltransferase